MPTTLTVEDLTNLADLIRKAGGIDPLRQHLQALAQRDAPGAPSPTTQVGQQHRPTRLAG
jgi:hypothetical protein